MRNRIPRIIVALLFLGFNMTAGAQNTAVYDLKVEVYGPPEVMLSGCTVTLNDLGHRGETLYAAAQSGDAFVFRAVPAGDYWARVFNQFGHLIHEESIHAGSGASVIRVNLPLLKIARPAAGRISVRQLQNPPNRKALKAFMEAQKFSAAGYPDKAAIQLEEAIRISPAFAGAYTNLAAAHLRMHEYERAVEESTRAMQVGSPNPLDWSNRALAEWALGRLDDAMRSAEQALRLDGSTETAHFVIGSLQIDDPRTMLEGIRHLERVAYRFPEAARSLERARAALDRRQTPAQE